MGRCLLKSHGNRLFTQRENLRSVGGYRHCVFPMGGQLTICGTDGPFIRIDLGMAGTEVEHRFDAQRHTVPQLHPLAGFFRN